MSWAEMVDQGVAGLMVEFLESRSADPQRLVEGLSHQVTGPSVNELKFDDAHARSESTIPCSSRRSAEQVPPITAGRGCHHGRM